MNKIYIIKLDNEIIGETRFEKSDPPMGIVFGKIINLKKKFNYSFIKTYCKTNNVKLRSNYPEDKLISTSTINQLRNDVAIDVQMLGSLFFYHS